MVGYQLILATTVNLG